MKRSFPIFRHASCQAELGPAWIDSLVLGAWTGRAADEREKHIAELALLGVARPTRVPIFYPMPVDRLTLDDEIEVSGTNTSGEAEAVIFFLDDGVWIGIGSDHTDRDVEAYSLLVSKQLCAKPVAREVWRLDDVASHWDQLILRSYAVTSEGRRLYQEGQLATLLSPEELAQEYSGGLAAVPKGTAMFGGTIPVIGNILPADRFEMELVDPVADRVIRHAYNIRLLPAD